jgi:hypothetical protein
MKHRASQRTKEDRKRNKNRRKCKNEFGPSWTMEKIEPALEWASERVAWYRAVTVDRLGAIVEIAELSSVGLGRW